jgi:integrase
MNSSAVITLKLPHVPTSVRSGGSPSTSTARPPSSALRFLYFKTLHRNFRRDDLVLPKAPRQELPVVLSREEAARLIESAANPRHRTILTTLYATGMRRSELCGLRPEDIDAQRMVLHILHGKGGRKRDVPLSPALLELRTYYRSVKHKNGWLFPNNQSHRNDCPIDAKTIWHAVRTATSRAAITKPIHPYTLRHYDGFRTIPGEVGFEPRGGSLAKIFPA